MKLQHVSILFVIIFMPIILVTSYFISLQVDTVKLQTSYDEKLLNATYDAMTAFELNTANEQLSSVADSLKSIIEASNNIFFNTLCTNLGVSNASKSYVQPFIPAILYTLYDGYYIYSPTNIPEICVDKYGRTIRTSDYGVSFLNTITFDGKEIGIYEFDNNSIIYSDFNKTEPEGDSIVGSKKVTYSKLRDRHIEEEYGQILYKNNDGTYSTNLHKISGNYDKSTYYKRDYILKSYIPYSASYSDPSKKINMTINYTLDNFMTIEGNIDEIYYTKSGYFIDQDLVSEIKVTKLSSPVWSKSITKDNWTEISEELLNEYILNPNEYEVIVTLAESGVQNSIQICNRDGALLVNSPSGVGQEKKYWEDAESAVQYYADSFIFSCWVHENLSTLQASDLKNVQYSVTDIQNSIPENISNETELYKDLLYNFSGDTTKPFSVLDNNPESGESMFYRHKRNVIKNSITYNLILSMIVYTEESKTVEYNMPVFTESQWDRILNNVSITAFMEGMKCGLKYYNNYAIVTSTNNEISVDSNEIYYVPRARLENGALYVNYIDDNQALDTKYKIAHRIDCDELNLINSYGAISFKSKEIKYDKILDSSGKYIYDHRVYTDYDCIVDSNYTVKTIAGEKIDGNTDVLKYLQQNSDIGGTNLQKNNYYKLCAYRIAVAKERNKLYKTTAFSDNYGCQAINFESGLKTSNGKVTIGIGNQYLKNLSNKNLKDIKKIEIVIEGAEHKSAAVHKVEVGVMYNENPAYKYNNSQAISTQSANTTTREYKQDFSDGVLNSITIDGTSATDFVVKEIKFYYK